MATIVETPTTEVEWLETLNSQVTDDGPLWYRRNYGRCVTVSGDGLVLAVGSDDSKDPDETGIAPLYDDYGRVYVYAYSGGSWSLRKIVTLTSYTEDFLSFGWGERSIALDFTGDKLVVGAAGFRDSNFANLDVGRIYTFTWDSLNYVADTDLEYPGFPDGGSSEYVFGRWLAMSSDGDTLVVGFKDWDITANNIRGYLRLYTWDGINDEWDFDSILKDVDSGPEEWGGYPCLNSDATFLLTLDDAAAKAPVFLEDTGSGLQRVAHTVQWAENSTQTRLLRVAMQEDGLAFWGYYNTTDGWRKFTKSGTTWVQSEEQVSVANLTDTSPELFPSPDGSTLYVTDIAVSPIGDSDYKGEVYEFDYSETVLSTCYEKTPEYGVIDYLCVEAPEPPAPAEPTPGGSLPKPPVVDDPSNPPNEYPYQTTCDALMASYYAAIALSDNPEYEGFVDEAFASGTLYLDLNGNLLCTL